MPGTPRRRRAPTTVEQYRALESEKDFQARVIQAAEILGWRVFAFHDSRRDVGGGVLVGDTQAKDFPDLFMYHSKKGRLIFAENKREGEEPRAGQILVIGDLAQIGLSLGSGEQLTAHVWHPSSWPEIQRELTR